MKRILWLVAMAALVLASVGVSAQDGSMPIIDDKLQASAAVR